jgi:hypothetical protein
VNSTEPREITNDDDVIDSRDIIGRIETLKSTWSEATGDDPTDFALSADDWRVGLGDDADELVALLALAGEASEYAADWQYGATLIRDSYFEDYARELAEDCGMIPDTYTWPVSHIDWLEAARALRMDYSSIKFDGVTYWTR